MAVNGLTPFNIEQFGGLDLRDDPEETGLSRALDATNVELAPGRVRTRPGTSTFSSAASGSSSVEAMRTYTSLPTGDVLIALTTALAPTQSVYALRYDGTVIASTSRASSQWPSIVTIGTPSASYAYVPTGQPSLFRFDGTTWTNPVAPAATTGPLGISPTDNRLVIGQAGNPNRVWFSDPGAPETFGANNWVDLTPGDGETIQAMATWNNQLFVFKQTKFFVFYGNSTDATGQPVFNYRTVAGYGALTWTSATAGTDGVYFLDRSGIYRTTSGPPVKISAPLEPFFDGTGHPSFLSGAPFGTSTDNAISWVQGRLYSTVVATTGNSATLVWDPRLDAWVAWKPSSILFTVAGETATTSAAGAARVLMLGASNGKIYRVDSTLTSDSGSSFTPSYQSGYSDLGAPAREKTIRETELVGTGTVNLAYAREFGPLDASHSVGLGTAPNPRRGLDRYARVGELLSYQLSGGPSWQVNRVVPMLRETRGVGEKT